MFQRQHSDCLISFSKTKLGRISLSFLIFILLFCGIHVQYALIHELTLEKFLDNNPPKIPSMVFYFVHQLPVDSHLMNNDQAQQQQPL